jgi:hypothetical protein
MESMPLWDAELLPHMMHSHLLCCAVGILLLQGCVDGLQGSL